MIDMNDVVADIDVTEITYLLITCLLPQFLFLPAENIPLSHHRHPGMRQFKPTADNTQGNADTGGLRAFVLADS